VSLVVVALGGNALLRRGEPVTGAVQERNAFKAARSLAPIARDHALVVTHGNGPQVGMLALRAEAYDPENPVPLDILGAESEGMIGYLLERGLRQELPQTPVAALLTQVTVDADDPAFGRPTKPIGPVLPEAEARRRARDRGWHIAPDGLGWRRVVPSPKPTGILELEVLRILVDHGVLPVCAGGGGVPVALDAHGRLVGVEGVVDKDRTASLLARELQADLLVLLTDVPGIVEGFRTAEARVLRRVTPEQVRALDLPAGSMGPKAEACAAFVEATGRPAAIGPLDQAAAVVGGKAGTWVVPPEEI
jgi:carbamate kinase